MGLRGLWSWRGVFFSPRWNVGKVVSSWDAAAGENTRVLYITKSTAAVRARLLTRNNWPCFMAPEIASSRLGASWACDRLIVTTAASSVRRWEVVLVGGGGAGGGASGGKRSLQQTGTVPEGPSCRQAPPPHHHHQRHHSHHLDPMPSFTLRQEPLILSDLCKYVESSSSTSTNSVLHHNFTTVAPAPIYISGCCYQM